MSWFSGSYHVRVSVVDIHVVDIIDIITDTIAVIVIMMRATMIRRRVVGRIHSITVVYRR